MIYFCCGVVCDLTCCRRALRKTDGLNIVERERGWESVEPLGTLSSQRSMLAHL
jgi:hypothetical protein